MYRRYIPIKKLNKNTHSTPQIIIKRQKSPHAIPARPFALACGSRARFLASSQLSWTSLIFLGFPRVLCCFLTILMLLFFLLLIVSVSVDQGRLCPATRRVWRLFDHADVLTRGQEERHFTRKRFFSDHLLILFRFKLITELFQTLHRLIYRKLHDNVGF